MLIPFKQLKEKYNIETRSILHLGAHWAEEAKDYYDNGVRDIIWVEADESCRDKIVYECYKFPELAFSIFNACLSDKDGEEVTFHISNNEGQSSSILNLDYHKIAHPEVHYVEDIQLKTKTVSTIFNENDLNIEDYPFVNLDLQGVELFALKGMEELLHKVKWIYTEVNFSHLYENCPLVKEIDQYLKQFGFEGVETVECGSFKWGDKFYINSNI